MRARDWGWVEGEGEGIVLGVRVCFRVWTLGSGWRSILVWADLRPHARAGSFGQASFSPRTPARSPARPARARALVLRSEQGATLTTPRAPQPIDQPTDAVGRFNTKQGAPSRLNWTGVGFGRGLVGVSVCASFGVDRVVGRRWRSGLGHRDRGASAALARGVGLPKPSQTDSTT